MKSTGLTISVAILSITGIVLSVLALHQAQIAKNLALSEIIVEQVNSLSTPVFDQDTNEYSYLTLYDISIANMSGPRVTLTRIKKSTAGAGFLTMLKGNDVVSLRVNERAFVSKESSSEIKNDPRLLKTIGQQDMGDAAVLNKVIDPGETQVIHIGLSLNPYDISKQALAHMALVSYELEFDNGKSYIFQRGFPIYPIK